MLSLKTEQWAYCFLLTFLLVSSILPIFSGSFITIAIILILSRMTLSLGNPMAYKAVISIGAWYLLLFFLLPFSKQPIVSFRQYDLLLISCIPFFLGAMIWRSKIKLLEIVQILSTCLVILAVLITFSVNSQNTVYFQPLFITCYNIVADQGNVFIFAGNLVILFPVFLILTFSKQPTALLQRCFLFFGTLSIIELLWQSNSWSHFVSIAAMSIICLIIFWQQRSYFYFKQALFLVILLLCTICFLFTSTGYYLELVEWLNAIYCSPGLWNIFWKNPVMGWGLDSLSAFYKVYSDTGDMNASMSSLYTGLINITVETGLVGIIGFILLLAKLIRISFWQWQNEHDFWSLIALVLTIGFFVESIFYYYLVVPTVMYLFYLIIGVACSKQAERG